jgi:hypothetical protein
MCSRSGGWGNFRAAIVNPLGTFAPARSGCELKSMQPGTCPAPSADTELGFESFAPESHL